ncbi:COPII coat assembly protein SEC16 [Marchantia polymorpha subsp. ruderalis]
MSPAPYPPLHAGDDVDASFFDQLGDELDFPVSEGVAHKHEDTGDVSSLGAPDNLELSSSASGSWTSLQKLQVEGLAQQSSHQDSNAQLDFELDDAFSELSIAKLDALSDIKPHSGDLHNMGNGDIHGEDRDLNMVSDVVLTGEDSLRPLANGGYESESDRGDVFQGSGALETSISTPLNIPGQDVVLPDSNVSRELGTIHPSTTASTISDATASSVKETSTASVADEDVKSPQASKPPKLTTDVTEVQWSDFGASAGFGSFSDLLSSFPADPSQHQEDGWNSGADFFQLTADASHDFGSAVLEQQSANAGVFDVQQTVPETQSFTSHVSSDLQTLGQESQTSVNTGSEEQTAYWQPQGQEQLSQSDQVEWQNPYPGWWYNNFTGVWRQVASSDNGAGAGSSWDTSGQYQTEAQTDMNQSYWQNQESNEVRSQENEQVVAGNGDISANQSVVGAYENEWTEQNPNTSGQSIGSHNPLFEASVVEQTNSTWSASGESGVGEQQVSWESQYPGWYYDHQAQEWKEENPSAPSEVSGTSQFPEAQQETLHLPAITEENGSYSDSAYQGYSSSQWYGGQDQQHISAGQYNQERPSSFDIPSTYATLDSLSPSVSTFPATITANPTAAEVTPRQWTGSQLDVQFGHAPSYNQVEQSFGSKQHYEVEQPQLNLGIEQFNSVHQAPYNLQHIDPQIAPPVVPESLYAPYTYPTATTFTPQTSFSPQIATQQTPEVPYNQFAPAQVPSHGAPTWPGVSPYQMQQPAGNSYQTQHYSQYAQLTPPKSTVEALRTSVGRPPHVLTAFGFGGKLVVMKLKDSVSLHASDGKQSFSSGQAWVPGPICVHNLSQIVAQSADPGRHEPGNLYFSSLSRQTFSGPLAGGSVSNKELTKWLDERGANCRTEEPSCKNPASVSMLWGLLKLACQHYGKLRSAVGTAGITSQEEDGPEVALANLLTSGVNQGSWTMGSFSSTVCLQPIPSEHQLQMTASEVKKLLVMGKRKEALKHALQGHLWGPALLLARQLGEKFYTDAVAQMAQFQFLPGSPMRTLSLLIAGQPAEVFSEKNMPITLGPNPMQGLPMSAGSSQDGLGSMLEEWQENLSIMAANRTNGDDRVISHLGDCLWKAKGEVAAAHICYLVADANFEAFTSTARLCLIGADHWKNPRTFATPEAIQRTEIYEYSKVLGNPQFILVPFQPYKLIYASMLAEAGKTSEALRYCQAVLKTLKTASRAPEVETCRQAAMALEERLRYHAQGGHAVNLAPGKLVRTLFSALDRGIHGIIGGPPQSSDQPQHIPKVDSVPSGRDQYTTNLSGVSPGRTPAPIVPSASAGKLQEISSMPPRSVSEPDFSSSMKEKSVQTKANAGAGAAGGYLRGLGSSLFQRVGFRKKEAKLGEKNKFYYDQKLKRWVEEGAQPTPEEVALPPPPTSANFVSKVDEHIPDVQSGVGVIPGPRTLSGTPPVPPSNQFSARAKQGVRSRYVDTFNKGGNATVSKPVTSSLFPTAKAAGAPMQPMSFFVPGPTLDNLNGASAKSEKGTSGENTEENHAGNYGDSASSMEDRIDTSQSAAAPNMVRQSGTITSSMHRVSSFESTSVFGGTDPIEGNDRTGRGTSNGGSSVPNGYHSRANSWGGYPSNFQNSQFVAEPPPNLAHDNSTAVTSISMYNGFSSQSSTTSTPVSSYFPSAPTKVDGYYPHSGDGSVDASLPPPPSIEPFTTSIGSGGSDGRAVSQAPVSFTGDDLQEVDF